MCGSRSVELIPISDAASRVHLHPFMYVQLALEVITIAHHV